MTKLLPHWCISALTLCIILFSCDRQPSMEPALDHRRFSKALLATHLDEPMEIAVLPDGWVVIIERKGGVKMVDPAERKANLIHKFDVFFGLEDGLLGVAADPAFKHNSFIYFYYSPSGNQPVQRVSRFEMKNHKIDVASEKVVIEIPTQRKECCHSAGSLAFGPDGNLYISVGDNTNPHNEGYYNSTDEREGREYWDAQRTAGNTNDLRGKILRIHVEPDGSYTIPEGNLFKPSAKVKGEIYAMGCRNPFRISVDAKRNWLFWGDVGQNTIDNPKRGPISYDEWHVAKGPGFFGWPYFAGPNAAYAHFNWSTQEIGKFYDAAKPVNASVNNTGLKELPPATGALIWYSYDESREFKHLGTGGKSPIAGPVFYSEQFKGSQEQNSIALPSYFDGKLIIAEWMRDWINVVTLTPDGKVAEIEPMAKGLTYHHPIDLELGPDGALYVLEYGTFWFANNSDAALFRIEYARGNRAPIVKIGSDKTAGGLPLTVQFNSDETVDLDSGSVLKYEWSFDQKAIQSADKNPKFTFLHRGEYEVRLKVTDEHGKSASSTMKVAVGNELPEVKLAIDGNESFYFDNREVAYNVTIADPDDPNPDLANRLNVFLSYSTMGTDMVMVEQSEETLKGVAPGWELLNSQDCKACHGVNAKSVGPSYFDIAQRYTYTDENVEKLATKVIQGGSGVWGENVMSAHPQLSKEKANEIVGFILSLNNPASHTQRISATGRFIPDTHIKEKSKGDYIFTVQYEDKPVDGIRSNVVKARVVLRNPLVQATTCDLEHGVARKSNAAAFREANSFIGFKKIDLTGIRQLTLDVSAYQVGGTLSAIIDRPEGKVLASVHVDRDKNGPRDAGSQDKEIPWKSYKVMLPVIKGEHDIYFVFTQGDADVEKVGEWQNFYLRSIEFK